MATVPTTPSADGSRTRKGLSWGTYLTSAMHAAGINNDADLALRADISQSLISRWRSGKTNPSDASLRKLSHALAVPFADLLVASGQATARELGMRAEPELPPPPPRRVDDRLLADVEDLDEVDIQRIRDFVKGLRAAHGDTPRPTPEQRPRP